MTQREEIRIEAMEDILNSLGIVATIEQITTISEDYAHHLEIEGDMDFNQHINTSDNKEKCEKCDTLQKQILDLEGDIQTYKNSVKKRRCASSVWLDGNLVRYN